ncbi:MAG: hypothetical protein K2J96_06790, partial [Bacteroidaceae bacterium]|nr:hypothetical protein [Bacteroidaceae bacterium]
ILYSSVDERTFTDDECVAVGGERLSAADEYRMDYCGVVGRTELFSVSAFTIPLFFVSLS